MRLPDSARSLIESGALAHCITLDPDGSPQVSAVWVGTDGDELVMAHMGEHRKVRNLRRDPRIALSFAAADRNEIGMQHYLVVHGRATITNGGAADLLRRLAEIYVGPGTIFPVPPDAPPGFITRITVERISGVGPWAG